MQGQGGLHSSESSLVSGLIGDNKIVLSVCRIVIVRQDLSVFLQQFFIDAGAIIDPFRDFNLDKPLSIRLAENK